MPPFYSSKIREDLQMSAKSVPLGSYSAYFFRFAMKMMSIMRDDILYTILFKVTQNLVFYDYIFELFVLGAWCTVPRDYSHGTERAIAGHERLYLPAGCL